jgi:16S rRNA (cytosine1402-N4)-methyltransferase
MTPVDGFLVDLGVSSPQLDRAERGFSFRTDGPLDMRMDPTSGETAAELLRRVDEEELTRIIREQGEERHAVRVARAIIEARRAGPVETTGKLAAIVARALPRHEHGKNPATRTFQALRIAVNRELAGLERFVSDAVGLLRPGGRVAVISFHSLEDRIVKRALRDLAAPCVCPPELPMCACGKVSLIRILTARPIRPTDDETRDNPRARSARLRGGERR